MDTIQDTRRKNLELWLESHSVPPREKSLFSQLKKGASFGERLARRLELDYTMGVGFLDRMNEVDSPNRGQNPPYSSAAKMLIEWVERVDALGDPARKIFSQMASILEVTESLTDSYNQGEPHSSAEMDEAEATLVAHTEKSRVKRHAARKRAGK